MDHRRSEDAEAADEVKGVLRHWSLHLQEREDQHDTTSGCTTWRCQISLLLPSRQSHASSEA